MHKITSTLVAAMMGIAVASPAEAMSPEAEKAGRYAANIDYMRSTCAGFPKGNLPNENKARSLLLTDSWASTVYTAVQFELKQRQGSAGVDRMCRALFTAYKIKAE